MPKTLESEEKDFHCFCLFFSLIHVAVIHDQLDVLSAILDVVKTLPYCNSVVNTANKQRQTPLHIAALVDNLEAVIVSLVLVENTVIKPEELLKSETISAFALPCSAPWQSMISTILFINDLSKTQFHISAFYSYCWTLFNRPVNSVQVVWYDSTR